MPLALDGSAVDIATLGAAVVGLFVKPSIRAIKKKGPCFSVRDAIVDALNGSAMVPFALLIGSVMSSELLKIALSAHKIQMAIAGLIAIIILFRELVSVA
jgi:hypothetical protein